VTNTSRLTLSLFFALALALGLYCFALQDPPSTELFLTESRQQHLEKFSLKSSAGTMTLVKADRPIRFGLTAEVKQGQWIVQEPALFPVRPEGLSKFFHFVTNLKSEKKLQPRKEFGFDESDRLLSVTSKGETALLKIGALNPVSKRRYVLEGERAMLVDDALLSSLFKVELTDTRPFGIALEQVTRVAVHLAGRDFEFHRDSQGRFVGGAEDYASERVEEYLTTVLSSKAIGSRWKGEPIEPRAKFTLRMQTLSGGEQESEVQIAPLGEGLVVVSIQGSDIEYLLSSELLRQLSRPEEFFIRRTLLAELTLEDVRSSCLQPELPYCPPERKLDDSVLRNFEAKFRRIEVIDIERLPGRLMMAGPRQCRLKSGGAERGTSFEVGAAIESSEAHDALPPRTFVADIGKRHYKGILSGVVAEDFCRSIDAMCNEAVKRCGGS
jgi:hypothetical protein